MAKTGIPSIDALYAREPGATLGTDRESVGAIQSLLIGHGFGHLPTMLSSAYGLFGPATTDAVRTFQTANGLTGSAAVDAETLMALVSVPAEAPLVSHPYAALTLDVPFTGVLLMAALTAQVEGGGYFAAANLNTDGCGLSFGMLQWSQRPGRLHELLLAFQQASADLFATVFAGGDQALADALVAHTAKAYGGVDPATGRTTDANFDLVTEPWCSRFQAAGHMPVFQKIQLIQAGTDFTRSAEQIQAEVPLVTSERGMAFMLDVANQFGDAGTRSIAQTVLAPAMSEADFLLAVQRESVARVARKYGPDSAETRSTLSRRQAIRTTPWLSDLAWTV